MTTTIKTSSKNYFNKIQKYLNNKRIFFTPSLNDGIYAITIFDTDDLELFFQVERVIRHFNLTKQQEPKALAA